MKLRSLALFLSIAALATAGCDKKNDGDSKSNEGTSGGKAVGGGTSDLAPFSGTLDYDLLKKVNRGLKMYGADAKPLDFGPVLAEAKRALGEPTHVSGTEYAWGFVKGDKCTSFVIENKNGKVDSAGAMEVDKMAGSMHEDCLKKLGKWKAPVADPNAPKVPTDGSPVTVKDLRAGVAGDKAGWVGKEVTVKAQMHGNTTMESDGKKTVTVAVVDSKETWKDSVGCKLAPGTEAPKIMQYEPITVKGKVTDTFGGHLDDCSIVEGK